MTIDIKRISELPLPLQLAPQPVQAVNFQPFELPEVKPDTVYATVKVDGKVVAVLYNSGAAEMSNATHGRVKKLPSMTEAEKSVGPELAQLRADEIAMALGGKVEIAKSAQSQTQWESGSSEVLGAQNPYRRLHKDAATQMAYDAKLIDQLNENVMNDFLGYMKKSPAERIRDMILKSKDLTEEDVANMSPAERKALEDEIARIIEEKIKEDMKRDMKEPQEAVKPIEQQNPNAIAMAKPDVDKELLNERLAGEPHKKSDTSYLEEMIIESA